MPSVDATTDGSSNVPDMSGNPTGRLLRRAIDHKVQKLRSMVSADEDITTELDKVVCRLMKLALKTSKGRKTALPSKWMQCKLLDLLTLTEKTIERRRQHFVKNYSFRAIGYGDEGQELKALVKFKEDKAGLEIMNKYHHLVNKTETIDDGEIIFNDDISLLSNEFKGNEFKAGRMSIFNPSWLQWHDKNNKSNFDRTAAWVNDDVSLVKYLNSLKDSFAAYDNDVEQSISNGGYKLHKPALKRYKTSIKYCTHLKKSSRICFRNKHKTHQKKANRKKRVKKILRKKSSRFTKGTIVKISTTNVGNFKLRKCIINSSLFQPTKSKPIPGSLIRLCNQVKITNIEDKTISISDMSKEENEVIVNEIYENYGNNNPSNAHTYLESSQRTFVRNHSFSKTTEPVVETGTPLPLNFEMSGAAEPAPDTQKESNKKSQTIFLYDINEPSTSKGVRHVSMDVQCGPDTSTELINHFAVTSCTDMCTRVESEGAVINTAINSADFGTSMYRDDKFYRTLMPRVKSVGIKIRDSDLTVYDNNNLPTIAKSDLTTCTNLRKTSVSALDSVTETDKTNVPNESLQHSDGNNLEDKTSMPKILSIIQDAPESIKSYLASSPKTLEANLANCLISRLKLCYSGIRISSFKSKKEFQEAYPSKPSQPTAVANKHRTISEQIKKESFIRNQKRDSKRQLVHPSTSKESRYTKNVDAKKNVLTPKSSFHTRKPSSVTKNVSYDDRFMKKIIQIRNPRLTLTKPKSRNEKTDVYQLPVTRSDSSRNRLPTVKKVLSKKGVSSELKNELKIVSTTHAKQEVNDLMNSNTSNNLNDDNIHKISKNDLNKSVDTVKHNIRRISKIPVLKRSKTEEIKNLSKLRPKVFSKYYVYRNETKYQLKAAEGEKDSNIRSSSPQSVQSSTCSSPTSVQTIKLRPKSLTSNSHSKIRAISPDSKSISSTRSKKSLKVGKKISECKFEENKENDIEYEFNSENLGPENKVYFAKINNTPLQSTENSLVKRKSSKSVRISNSDNLDDKKDSFVVKNLSSKSISIKKFEHDHITIVDQDVQYVLHDNSYTNYPRSSTPVHEEDNDGYKLRQMIENPMKEGYSLDIMASLVDDIIERSVVGPIINDNCHLGTDTQTVPLDPVDCKDDCFDESLSFSFGSGKTAVENLDIIKEHDEDDPNNTMNTVIARDLSMNGLDIVPESDVLSFRPTTSSSLRNASPIKNYRSSSVIQHENNSLLDLFERRNHLGPPVNASPLALQTFSGFSVNTEPIPGDQPDYVNQIDSETGSGANDVNRHATSEELFVSGRSSVMYESCLIEDDTIVPEWLFQIISHQQMEPEEVPELRPAILPVAEPMYDMNGNAVEPALGNEAGAGDGRGVHSDVSQDSSGQGSSITSSETSSAPQSEVSCTGVSTITSEAILIDPTALTGQYPTTLPLQLNSDSFRSTQESSDNADPPRSSREVHQDAMALLGASDADADESSLDTDAD